METKKNIISICIILAFLFILAYYCINVQTITREIHPFTNDIFILKTTNEKNLIIENSTWLSIEENEKFIIEDFLKENANEENEKSIIENSLKENSNEENDKSIIEDGYLSSSFSKEDERYLSAIVYAEAGNQCEAGQQAVAIVVVNRSESSDFSDGIYNVIYQSGQFTPTTNGALDKCLSLYDNNSLPSSCIDAAQYALQGNKTVIYNGISYDLSKYYYFSRYIKNAKLVIQDHMFK